MASPTKKSNKFRQILHSACPDLKIPWLNDTKFILVQAVQEVGNGKNNSIGGCNGKLYNRSD